jgi:hypothetical protein
MMHVSDQNTHAHERVRSPRGAWRAARAVFWGVLALHQSATMSTNLDPSDVQTVLDVLGEAEFFPRHWRTLGRRLGVNDVDLDTIDADFKSDGVKRCLEAVIDIWKRNGENTWGELADAVSKCECSGGGSNVARKVREKVGLQQGAGDTTMDAREVFEEIKEAKKKAFALGLKLNLPATTRKRINSESRSPDDRLLKTLEEYMKLMNPKPSWEGIATALNDKFVGLPELANRIRETHCSDRKVVLKYEHLTSSFGELTQRICAAIEDRGIDVDSVVDAIRGLARGERDKAYFMEFTDHLRGSQGVPALFDRLCYNWDYLHPEIYRPLVGKLSLTGDVEQAAEDYLEMWVAFVDQTPLAAFCRIPDIEVEKEGDPPPGFVKHVKKVNWEPPPKYLRDVENLRRKFARKCNLQSCAVTIVDFRMKSTMVTIITMWVPKSIELYFARDLHFITEHSIVQMVFNGMIVYSQDPTEVGSSVDTVRKVQPSRVSVTMKYIMKELFDKPVRRVQKYLKSPLARAAAYGTLQEARELIVSGEDPNPHTVATPLKEACTRGDLEIARVLLEAGADPNLVTDAWTPLMEAARLGNREMIQLLVEFGADPNTTNEENWTALMAASNNGRTEAVDQLVQFGADPNMQDYVRNTLCYILHV